jgi:hypothetical protein
VTVRTVVYVDDYVVSVSDMPAADGTTVQEIPVAYKVAGALLGVHVRTEAVVRRFPDFPEERTA